MPLDHSLKLPSRNFFKALKNQFICIFNPRKELQETDFLVTYQYDQYCTIRSLIS